MFIFLIYHIDFNNPFYDFINLKMLNLMFYELKSLRYVFY